jgi:hypothetical protein
MQDHTFTLLISAVGIGGALAGIVVGHFLTRSSQHEQWLRDCRKQEFKEVVSAMSSLIIQHMIYAGSQGSDMPQSKQTYLDAYRATSVILCDRIYIHDDLKEGNIPNRFYAIMEHYRDSGTNFEKANQKADELLLETIKLGRKG